MAALGANYTRFPTKIIIQQGDTSAGGLVFANDNVGDGETDTRIVVHAGAPVAQVMGKGTFWMDKTNGVLYYTDDGAGNWIAVIGADKLTAAYLSGAGAPVAASGTIGTLYVDTATGILYIDTDGAGTWVKVGVQV